jgi:hypothetical protein
MKFSIGSTYGKNRLFLKLQQRRALRGLGGEFWTAAGSMPFDRSEFFWMPDRVRHDDLRTFYETIEG